MSLRTRLIVAFFLLSVVPLAAVTFISYTANERALREAAQRETDLLTAELGQRMQLVTAQLQERVEHLMDLTELQADLEAVSELRAAEAEAQSTAMMETIETRMADSLGEAAMLLSNVEVTGLRGRGGGRGGRGGGRRGGGGPPPDGVAADGAPPNGFRGGGNGRGAPPPDGQGEPTGRNGSPATGAGGPPNGQAANSANGPVTEDDRLQIDLGPIQREIFDQLVPGGPESLNDMSPEERARVLGEINARMFGIRQGIEITAAEIQRRAEEARQQAEADASQASATTTPLTPATRRVERTETGIAVVLERDGEEVSRVSADFDVANMLATIFATTRRDRGEVPFGVAPDGQVYASSDEDARLIESFGDVARPDGPAVARLDDWIVVTTLNPAGIGMKVGIARPVGDSLNDLRRTAATNAGFGLLLIGVALVGIAPLSGRLTRHLEALSEGVRRIARGDYQARVEVRSKDEIGELAGAFNQMATDVERHQRAAVEQERIRRELELGRKIQHDMLPDAPLTVGLTEVQGVSVPAREVGGDFFNYFELPSGQLALLVGDVSGKGVGAALLMANIQASLRIRLSLGQELRAIADEIDRDIEENSPGPLYATLFVGILDPTTRMLTYVNAGHNPQYLLRAGGGLAPLPSTGLPAGLFAGRGYTEEVLQLSPGDVLFFYTDGCVEAEAPSGEMFGAERLESVLREVGTTATAEVLSRVEQVVTTFRHGRELHDDATMMAVRIG